MAAYSLSAGLLRIAWTICAATSGNTYSASSRFSASSITVLAVSASIGNGGWSGLIMNRTCAEHVCGTNTASAASRAHRHARLPLMNPFSLEKLELRNGRSERIVRARQPTSSKTILSRARRGLLNGIQLLERSAERDVAFR